MQTEVHYDSPDQSLDIRRYINILKRRKALLIFPFIVVLAVGFAVTMMLPAVYRSEARMLVETQQIPTTLVQPTVTASAKERIQVIEQRVKTRDNLLGIVNKFKLFPPERFSLSGSDALEKMRDRISMTPVELDQVRRRNDTITIAVSVGFEHENPQIARAVANELVTIILNEDARNRTNRAAETTRFLAREVKRLESEIASIDAQILEAKRKSTDTVSEKVALQLIALRAELREKSTLYSERHPEINRIQRQIASLEAVAAATAPANNLLEGLQNKRENLQKNLESTSQKVATARLGESLERDQFSERLEVLEQAVLPQKPVKPNRIKLLALVVALAVAAGVGSLLVAEMLDNSIRSSRDLFSLIDPQALVTIPYIATRAEVARRKARMRWMAGGITVSCLLVVVSVHLFVRPLDQLWEAAMIRLLAS
jgi:uncharacterized protein involved in exopolysaccharide biosynthesis